MIERKFFSLVLAVVGLFVGVTASAADPDAAFVEKAMKECIIPEVEFKEGQTLLDAVRFFREYPPILKTFAAAGRTFTVRLKRDEDWQIAPNGDPLPPKIRPYHVKNVSLYYALKSVCLPVGYRFRIEGGVVRVVANRLSEVAPRNWTSVNGKKMYGRWAGLLANGKGVVVRREKDNELVYTLYSKLSRADMAVVDVPGERDFMPYYYIYGWRDILWTDNIICSAQEALREQRYIDRAVDIILRKSYLKKRRYKVFQVCGGGALCSMWTGRDYNGEVFFMPSDQVADFEMYEADYLFWLGTYSYDTVRNERRTVNVYASGSIFDAVDVTRRRNGLFDRGDPRFDDSGSVASRDGGGGGEGAGDGAFKGSGSGVIITASGYLLTNAHVVKGASRVKVETVKGTVAAKVVRVDEDNDLALLKVSGEYKPVSFSVRRKEPLGATVFTVGFPRPDLQGFEPKVTKGVVSGLEGFRGDVKNYQIDAAIQPGNSGGLLADEQGNLVGIVCAALVGFGNGEAPPRNVNYAIKKSFVLAFVDSVPECSESIREGESNCRSLEEAVASVRESCVRILVCR